MSVLDSLTGGDKAKEAGEIQQQYGYSALQEFLRDFGLSQLMLDPYNQGGLYALEQLIGTGGTKAPVTPGVQAQVDAWKNWSGDARKAPGYIGGQRGWDRWEDKENFIDKNRASLEAMLPTGMSVKDVPNWQRWIMNPHPVDRWGNPLDESLWKYPQEQGEGGESPNAVAGILNQGIPSVEDTYRLMQDDPWYQLQQKEGRKALESSAAGRGMLQSGDTGKGLLDFGQDLAYRNALGIHQQQINDIINTQINPLLSILGGGQVAAGQMSQNALQSGLTSADLTKYQGEAIASGYLGQAAARQNALGGVMGLAGQLGGAALGGVLGGPPGAMIGGSLGGMFGGAAGGSGGGAPSIGNMVGGGAKNDYGLSGFKFWE